jgi:hypothetical protein
MYQVQFCNLRAVDTALDGSYVVLADGGTLLRFDLLTDESRGNIRQLEASIDHVFSKNICSVAVLEPDSTIVMHDCGTQQLFVAMGGDGSHVQMVADWSDVFSKVRLGASDAPDANLTLTYQDDAFKAYYNKKTRTAVVAGTLLHTEDGIAAVQLVNISAFNNFFVTGSTANMAVIPRTAYNVWEGGGIKRASMDMEGMQPRAVLYEVSLGASALHAQI